MRGSGKSTIARRLAAQLKKRYIDLDIELAKKVMMPIAKFVQKYGWDNFREKETEVIEDISETTNVIISTGGGAILRKKNIAILERNGTFVFLKASLEELFKRIGNDKKRVALTNEKTVKEEIETIWEERKTLYETTADITIETDKKTLDEIVKEIIKQI